MYENICDRSTLIKHIDIHGLIPPPIIKKVGSSKPNEFEVDLDLDLDLEFNHKKHETKVINPVICDICNKTFLALKRLNEHKLCHLKPFKCSICHKTLERNGI